MRHRSGIIRTVMKLPKRIYLIAAVVLFMGGAGTAVALYPDSTQPKVVVEQTASQQPQEQPPTSTETTPAVIAETATEEQPVAPQETIQQWAEQATRAHASKFDLDPDQQWLWMDAYLSQNIGYDNEDKIKDFINTRFQERLNEQGGYTVVYWQTLGHEAVKTVYL